MKIIFTLLLSFTFGTLSAQSEADHIRAFQRHYDCEMEVSVTSGRVDLLTATTAYEVEWANNWKNSIGQALWYGLQTNRKAGIILLLRQPSDYRYYQQLNSALSHAGLTDQIDVSAYPNDFPDLVVTDEPNLDKTTPGAASSGKTDYWLTTNSGKRHRKTCRWYEESKGRYCGAEEGVGAGCCY